MFLCRMLEIIQNELLNVRTDNFDSEMKTINVIILMLS